MIIKNIQIKNYKSFKDSGKIDVHNNIQSFVGKNNTGKSAIFDAIECFFEKDKKVILSDFHKETIEDIEISIEFSNVSDLYLKNILFRNIDYTKEKLEELKKFKEEMLIEDEKIFIKMISKKTEDGKIKNTYINSNGKNLVKKDVKKLLPELKVIPAIRDPQSESTGKNKSYLSDLLKMIDDEMKTSIAIEGENITYKELNTILEKENNERCKTIAENITDRYSMTLNSDEIEVRIDSKVDISKGTEYSTKIYNKQTKIESDILDSGTGYQSMIILSLLQTYVDMTRGDFNYILLIEEPEVYLHPSLQRKMIDTLINISKNSQVLFTTHSPVTLSKLNSRNIKVVEKNEGEASIKDSSTYRIIKELGIKPDDIFYSNGIIFVEGKDDQILFNKILKKIDKDLDINVIETNGCENLSFFASAEILLNSKYNIPVLIIRDSDGKDRNELKNEVKENISQTIRTSPNFRFIEEDKTTEILQLLDSNIYILEKHSIEDYFIHDKFLEEFHSDNEELNKAIKCFYCKYDLAISKKENQNNIAKYFQPKRFIKGHPDVPFKSKNLHEESFVNKWNKLKLECDCSNKKSGIDNFLKVRENIISEINKKEKNMKIDYIDYILEKDIEILKGTDLIEIIDLLQRFKLELKD